MLTVHYRDGDGVPQDSDETLKWLRQAAEHGETNAQHELGVTLVARNDTVGAYPWLVLADAAGNRQSQETLTAITPTLNRSDVAEIRFELGAICIRPELASRETMSRLTHGSHWRRKQATGGRESRWLSWNRAWRATRYQKPGSRLPPGWKAIDAERLQFSP